MKRLTILACVCMLALAGYVGALEIRSYPGATNLTIPVRAFDVNGDPNTSVVVTDWEGFYKKEGAAPVSFGALTPKDAHADTHVDGNAIGDSNGWVDIDVPDAAFSGTVGTTVVIGAVDGTSDDTKDKIIETTVWLIQDANGLLQVVVVDASSAAPLITSDQLYTGSELGDKIVADMDANSTLPEQTVTALVADANWTSLVTDANTAAQASGATPAAIVTELVTDANWTSLVTDANTAAIGVATVDNGAIADEVVTHMDANSTQLAAIVEDTGTTIPGTITTIDNEIAVIDGIVDDINGFVDTEVAAILEDTNEVQADGVMITAAAVNAVWAKTMSDLSAGNPQVTESVLAALTRIWLANFGKVVTNGTNDEIEWYNDAGTKIAESPFSDDDTDFTKNNAGAND